MKKGDTRHRKPGYKITNKQKIFCDEIMKTNNATKAAMKAYNCKDKSIAAKVGSENLKKPDIIQYFKDNAGIASSYMVSVIENPDDRTSDKITAAKDVLDRAGYRPTDNINLKQEVEVDYKNMSLDQLIKIAKSK